MQTSHGESEWGDFSPRDVPETPGFKLESLDANRYQLSIWGRFLPGWLSGFTAGMAHQQISILRGAARKISPAVWFATLEIEAAAARANAIDYLALAQSRRPASDAAQIRLSDFRMRIEDNALYVEVRGEDQVGFLDAILRKFTLYSLFPAEMMIETKATRVLDRFWFKGIGGLTPCEETVHVLRDELQALIAPLPLSKPS